MIAFVIEGGRFRRHKKMADSSVVKIEDMFERRNDDISSDSDSDSTEYAQPT